MRNSLLLKLTGAFLLVIVVGAAVIGWTVSRATEMRSRSTPPATGRPWRKAWRPSSPIITPRTTAGRAQRPCWTPGWQTQARPI